MGTAASTRTPPSGLSYSRRSARPPPRCLPTSPSSSRAASSTATRWTRRPPSRSRSSRERGHQGQHHRDRGLGLKRVFAGARTSKCSAAEKHNGSNLCARQSLKRRQGENSRQGGRGNERVG